MKRSFGWMSGLLACVAMLLPACDGDQIAVEPLPEIVEEQDPVELGDQPYRPRRRMDVRQLENSLRRVSGGIEWRINSNTTGFERYARTLGEPDYVERTVEDREVSVLFLKFLDDAARDICDELIEQEWQEDATDRVFMVHAGMTDTLASNEDAIRENLRYLLLRFHGRRVAVDSAELQPWTQLLNDVAVASQGEGEDAMPEYRPAWESVCVTLINHPDFFTY